MRKLLLSLLVPAVIFSSFTPKPDRASFSGDWKLNEGKSELGEFGGRFTPRSIKVDQKQDNITIAKTRPGFNGGDPVTTTMTMTYDGKETETTGFGNSKIKSTAKWSDDGQTLNINSVTTFERDGQTSEFKGSETWTLTKDGGLSIVTVSSSPRGENTIKAVYDK
jgi:hypothetical protein